ncbi:hypothetical protein DFH09DRAFT_1280935 [Mycena vulgaris]|nr:hypothetical protein DFH09DRAFT_1280935 [Mycena vulgaris]
MPPRSQVQTRSKSVSNPPPPAQPAPSLPPSAPPSEIAVSGYPDRTAPSTMAKSKTAISALHFGKNPVNSYTGSKVKGKAPASRPPSSASAVSSNAFAALSDHAETNTVEERATIDLLGLPDDSFTDSNGGDISSSDIDVATPATDPIKALARRLERAQRRPPTPPGTTSGAGSSTSTPPPAPSALGCAQNANGSLRDANDIVFFHDADDDTPLPAPQPTPVIHDWQYAAQIDLDAATTDAHSPFLSPVPGTAAPPSPPSAAISSVGSASPASPVGTNIANAAAAAGRARQARNAAASAPIPPVVSTSISAPPVLPSPAPPPAPTTATPPLSANSALPTPTTSPLSPPRQASQPIPAAPSTTVAPLFTTVVTRGQAARRAAAGPPTGPSPFNPLPHGMFIPTPPALPAAPSAAPIATQPPSSSNPAPNVTTGAPMHGPQPAPAAHPLNGNAANAHVPAQTATPSVAAAAPVPAAGGTPPLAAGGTGGIAPAAGAAGAPPRVAPAAAAAAFGGAALPAYCPIPLDIPGIYSPDSISARENVAPRQLNKWDLLVGGKFLAYEWEGKPHSINSTTVEDLKTAISRITGAAAPLVGPPEATSPGSRASPYMYLVRGVSDADTQLLLSRPVWNLVGGTTFFTIPYDPPSSPFLFTLDGFSFGADEGVEVANIVVSEIYGDHDAQALLALNHDNYPTDEDPMSHFAASVRVTPISLQNSGGRPRTAWNVTATPPSLDAAINRAWVAALSALKYDSTMHWYARAVSPPLFCSGCKSLGHVLGLCPLPQISGWYIPKPPASAPTTGSSSAPSSRGPRPAKGFRGNVNGQNRGRNNNGGRAN